MNRERLRPIEFSGGIGWIRSRIVSDSALKVCTLIAPFGDQGLGAVLHKIFTFTVKILGIEGGTRRKTGFSFGIVTTYSFWVFSCAASSQLSSR